MRQDMTEVEALEEWYRMVAPRTMVSQQAMLRKQVSESRRRRVRERRLVFGAWLLVVLACIGFWLVVASSASASSWSKARATWYGPGFYGHTTACGQRYSIRHRGVAVPSSGRYHMRCGTKLTICRRPGRGCVRVVVTDTGGFRDHRFDLSARTSMDLCGCWKPYTLRVWWRYR